MKAHITASSIIQRRKGMAKLSVRAKKRPPKINPKVGETVDPERHQVLMAGEGKGILEVFEWGWELEGKVLLPAKVKAGEV